MKRKSNVDPVKERSKESKYCFLFLMFLLISNIVILLINTNYHGKFHYISSQVSLFYFYLIDVNRRVMLLYEIGKLSKNICIYIYIFAPKVNTDNFYELDTIIHVLVN